MNSHSIKIIIVLLLTISFGSCDKDVDMLANYKDSPIIYGLIDANDSISYIRIQKAFLSEENIYDDALIADSNLYDYKLDVSIKSGNQTIVFDTITLNTKEAGIFFSPNIPVYYAATEGLFNKNSTLELKVRNPKTGNIATSTAKMIDAKDIDFIRPVYVVNLKEDFEIDFVTVKDIRIYQLVVRFHYMEMLPFDTASQVFKYTDLKYEIDFTNQTGGGETIRHHFDSENFIDNLINTISPTTELERYTGHLELMVETSEDSFFQYYTSVQPDNSVIVHDKNFTNIENGYGIFAGISSKSRMIRLDQISKLYLRNIEGLNFIGSIPEEE